MQATSDRAARKHRRPVILIVDDDAVVTQSLSAFLTLETDFDIVEMQSPSEAIELLKRKPVDLVISDFLMPGINGLQLLDEAKRLYPDVPRILLTGYADKENAIRAINEVGLFQYVEKPWDNEQFLLVIQNALRTKSLQETLAKRIHELDEVLLERSRLQQRDELLRGELRQAQQLQRSMLPETLPNLDGVMMNASYFPALEIGGDFYDVIPLADDKLGVLVADATGHGIQAALSTAVVKFAFAQFTHCPVGATEIIKGMNRVLYRGLPADTFAAAAVLVLDVDQARCTLVNAGLPHPYRVRRSQNEVEQIFAEGFMLGVIEDDLYQPAEETLIQLESGDTLLLYTDGLSEVEDENGEQFDMSRLREVLVAGKNNSCEDLCDALIQSSKEFGRNDHKWDDITILGITLK
ncbi:MAG: SpoIIE family protein phosphatase [Candidatus Latescibacterota bacterium]|nr:MAG: SpoIIE family protein phosphatase [Candidatus Latescibacterota bacterium]